MSDEIINKLIEAAENHGDDDDPQHQVGDLEDMVRLCWSLMSVEAKQKLLETDNIETIIECGARDEFDLSDLEDILRKEWIDTFEQMKELGYEFIENDFGHKWVFEGEGRDDESPEFPLLADAAMSARKDWQEAQQTTRSKPKL